jgi:hypothetical protein
VATEPQTGMATNFPYYLLSVEQGSIGNYSLPGCPLSLISYGTPAASNGRIDKYSGAPSHLESKLKTAELATTAYRLTR